MLFTKSVDKKKELVSELRPNDDLILSEPTRLAEEKKDKGDGKSGSCGKNLRWALDEEGTLSISGNGPMKDYRLVIEDSVSEEDLWFELEYGDWCASVGDTQTHYVSPWHDAGVIRKVIFEEGVTSVGAAAFMSGPAYYGSAIRSNSYAQLAEITFPSSLEVVEICAFEDCEKLASIEFSVGLKRIEWRAFCHCQSLTSVTLPDGTQEIGVSAFEECDNLSEISIPASVTTIGKDTFASCPKLVIHAPAGSYAEKYAEKHQIPFEPKQEKEEVKPYWVTDGEGTYWVRGTGSIVSGGLSDSYINFFGEMFQNETCLMAPWAGGEDTVTEYVSCHKVKTVHIGPDITELRWGAFGGCCDIESIHFASADTMIYDGIFGSEWSSCTEKLVNGEYKFTVHAPAGGAVEEFAGKHNLEFIPEEKI